VRDAIPHRASANDSDSLYIHSLRLDENV
jgi:hypothetical protein